jgi:integrase
MSEPTPAVQKELELFLLEMRYREGRLTPAEGNRTFLLDDAQAVSTRAIGMSPTLRDVLWTHKLDAPASELDLVFCNEAGGLLDQANLRNRVFEPALVRAGLRRIRIHDLRHTFASLLIHQGENLKYVQSQLGHASIQTTVDRYGHLMPDAYLGASERLDATLFGDSAYKPLTSIPEKQKAGDSMSLRPAVSW